MPISRPSPYGKWGQICYLPRQPRFDLTLACPPPPPGFSPNLGDHSSIYSDCTPQRPISAAIICRAALCFPFNCSTSSTCRDTANARSNRCVAMSARVCLTKHTVFLPFFHCNASRPPRGGEHGGPTHTHSRTQWDGCTTNHISNSRCSLPSQCSVMDTLRSDASAWWRNKSKADKEPFAHIGPLSEFIYRCAMFK
jgi:hypothetical protein